MYKYKAIYKSNYDGDTIKFDVDLGFSVHLNVTVRLSRVDTPELRGTDAVTKELAYKAKDRVANILSNATSIFIITEKDKTGKYGRYIAEVEVDGVNLSDLLLEEGLAELF